MIKLRYLSNILGVEVSDFNLNSLITTEHISFFKKLLDKHYLLVFRNQQLDELEQINIASRFGKILPHPLKKKTSNNDEITVIKNNGNKLSPNDKSTPNFLLWHVDMCYEKVIPKYSILYAQQIPTQGGNTLFANCVKAFDAISEDEKELLKKKFGLYAFTNNLVKRCKQRGYSFSIEKEDIKVGSVHPLINRNPRTGRFSILANWSYTERVLDVTSDESDKLLEKLYSYYSQDKYIYSHKYLPNDFVIWDNNSLIHAFDSITPINGARTMRRIIVE